MEPRRIKDNTSYESDAFDNIGNLIKKVANKTLEQLEYEGVLVFPKLARDAEDLSKDQMILQDVNGKINSGNVIGFIGYGNERLIIKSRFAGEDDHFFLYLLNRVMNIPNIVDLKTDANQDERLFNYLVFLFPYYLKNAMRKGLYKKYIRQEYNDGNVKGAIDIARHIKTNTPFIGKVAYSQREFSFDNFLTELVRHTIEFIKSKPYGRSILHGVNDEIRLIVEATPRYEHYDRLKIIEQNKKNSIHHAFYQEYLALQRLCLLILRHEKHLIGSGSRQIYGILFDGSWLWEEYINTIIKEDFYHPMNKAQLYGQKLFNKNTGLIYPDFISRNFEKRIIVDAKYKPKRNIKNQDYLQLLAYMFRFESKTGYYIYPEVDNAEDTFWMNRGTSFEYGSVYPRDDVCITKYGFKIPMGVVDFTDFALKMEISEQQLKNDFSFAN